MNGAKEHLDKILAVVVIVACLGWVAKTHLEVKEEEVTNAQIDAVLTGLEKARKNPVKSAPVEKYAERFKANMAMVEAPIDSELVSWKFYPMPDSGPVPPEKWELEAVFANAAAAEKGATRLRNDGVKRIKALGRRLRLEGFVSKVDPIIDLLRRKCLAAGAASTEVVEKGVVLGVGYAALGAPSISVAGVMVGKAVLKGTLGSDGDRFCERTLVRVWRKKASAAEWPEKPLVAVTSVGDKVTVAPPGAASLTADTFEITETKLPAREAFEYRVRKVACFLREVREGETTVEVLPPKKDTGVSRAPRLDPLLGKQKVAYATGFSPTVKVETPGEVQIQYAGSGGFRLRRKVPGLGQPVATYRMFRPGQRVRFHKDKRVKVGNRSVLKRFHIDAEVNLVALITEKRRLPIRKFVFEKDPETGATVQRVKMVPGPEVEVPVAVIEDVRSGKKHKLDKARGRDSGWWPENVVMQPGRPEQPKGGTNTPGSGGRRDASGSRRAPVGTGAAKRGPKAAEPANSTSGGAGRPKGTRTEPRTPKAVSGGTPSSSSEPDDPVASAPQDSGVVEDPGKAPVVTDVGDPDQAAAFKEWSKRKQAYDAYLKKKRESEGK